MRGKKITLRVALLAGLTIGYGCAVQRTVPVSSGTQFAVTGNDSAVYFDMQGILWRIPLQADRPSRLATPVMIFAGHN